MSAGRLWLGLLAGSAVLAALASLGHANKTPPIKAEMTTAAKGLMASTNASPKVVNAGVDGVSVAAQAFADTMASDPPPGSPLEKTVLWLRETYNPSPQHAGHGAYEGGSHMVTTIVADGCPFEISEIGEPQGQDFYLNDHTFNLRDVDLNATSWNDYKLLTIVTRKGAMTNTIVSASRFQKGGPLLFGNVSSGQISSYNMFIDDPDYARAFYDAFRRAVALCQGGA